MTRRRLVVGVVGLLVTALSIPALANNAWGEYHWDGSSTPVSLSLENNLSGAQWTGVLESVETDWDTSGVLSLGIVSPDGSTNCADPLANTTPANSGLTEVCNGSYGQNGWLGVARIWIDDGVHISAAIAAVNDSYLGPGAAYDNDNARRHVLCQEVGHTFGLDHQKSPRKQSCMNAQWGLTSSSFISPNQHDYDQLASIYAHLDGTSEEGGNGGGPCDKKPDHPKCQAGGSPGHSFEVERLANGQIMLTWITWAPGYGPDH